MLRAVHDAEQARAATSGRILSIACWRGDAALALAAARGRRRAERQRLPLPLGRARRTTHACGCCSSTARTATGTNALWHALDYERFERVRLLRRARRRSQRICALAGPPYARDPRRATSGGVPAPAGPVRRRRHAAADHNGSHGGSSARIAEVAPDLARGTPPSSVHPTRSTSADSVAERDLQRNTAERTPSSLDDDARDVLIELAMRDIGGLARVVDAVGADFSATRWGGGPTRTRSSTRLPGSGDADCVELLLSRGAKPVRTCRDGVRDASARWAAVGSGYSARSMRTTARRHRCGLDRRREAPHRRRSTRANHVPRGDGLPLDSARLASPRPSLRDHGRDVVDLVGRSR